MQRTRKCHLVSEIVLLESDDGEALLLRAHPRVRRGTTSSRPPRYATTQCARWGACYRIVNESASRLKRAGGEGHRLSRSP